MFADVSLNPEADCRLRLILETENIKITLENRRDATEFETGARHEFK